MMEKHGEIREGLTPPEPPEQTEDKQAELQQAASQTADSRARMQQAVAQTADKQAGLRQAAELMKETEARFSRLEEHMTKRSYTCITENLR